MFISMLERGDIFIAVTSIKRWKLTRFKISADTFAGEYFMEEIERHSRYNVVQMQSVSYPPDATAINRRKRSINISLISSCYL